MANGIVGCQNKIAKARDQYSHIVPGSANCELLGGHNRVPLAYAF
jgi:hypothetical protein